MVDPSERLLAAVTELLVTQGWEGVSIRKVAAAAGVSIGSVQHHFPTKEAMLAAAMDRASREFQARLASRVPADASSREALIAVAELLVVDDQDDRGAAVSVLWLVQAARAAVDPATAERHGREWREVENLLVTLLAAARPDRDRSWAQDRGTALLALLDGLAVAVAAEPARMPPDRARRLLAQSLDDLLTPDPRGPGPRWPG